jgi:hypothetical protein|tara:strand:- start:725 stop:1264 length:540 start_codon:yes stop_codon:yes gene_type:complete
MSKIKITTPKGEFKWASVQGAGKKDLQGRDIFSVDIEMPYERAQPLVDEITAFWESDKPKGAKDPKSTGFRIMNDGMTVKFAFKTSAVYPSGDPKEVTIYDAKAQRTKVTDKIGNGSVGRVSGMASIYDAGVAARGVTLYLDSLQLIKLVRYEEAASFDVEEGDDVFTSDATFVAEDFA